MTAPRPHSLTTREFDLIVVGGGVYGATIALEAVLRGLRPLLLEKADFGSGTSAHSLRILHGGLRYLQSADLVRFRQSVRQRRWWARHFPELVEPLECVMPLYGRGLQRRSILRGALAVNDLLSADRNRGVPHEVRLPRGRILDRAETTERFPLAAERSGLQGAAVWYDLSMVSVGRLMMELLRWAQAGGARAFNYTTVTGLLTSGSSSSGKGSRYAVQGVRARDELEGTELEFRAPVVVNAAGPWVRDLAGQAEADGGGRFQSALAFNLLLDRPLPGDAALAVGADHPGAQTYFLRPMGEFTFAGTAHAPWPRDEPPPSSVPERLLAWFLSELEEALPGFSASPDRVLRQTCGLLPARAEDDPRAAIRPVVVHHASDGGPSGFVSVSGVKFTTAPAVARRILDRVVPEGGRGSGDSPAVSRPPVRRWRSPEEVRNMVASDPHGTRAWLETLIEEEAVQSMDDLVLRRLDWGLSLRDPEDAVEILDPVLGEGDRIRGMRSGS